MKKLLYIKDLKEFSKVFEQEREKRRKQLAKLPFARKIAILEKMQRAMSPLKTIKRRKLKKLLSMPGKIEIRDTTRELEDMELSKGNN